MQPFSAIRIAARAAALCGAILSAIAVAPPASAQSGAPPSGEAVDIPVEEWTAMARGRTLTYRIGDELWAMERYAPDSDRVRLQFRDGSCLEGTWDYEAPLYCFHWRDQGTSCFRHMRRGDEILVIEAPGGEENGQIQFMTEVSDLPLACGPAVTS